MIPVVEGKNCILEVRVNGSYQPLLCAENFTFTLTQEMVLKTGPNSGLFRERKARLSDWNVEVSGLTPIDDPDTVSWFYMLQNSVRRAVQALRMTFEDQAGEVRVFTGSALVETQEISASMTDFANASISLVGTGGFDISEVIDGPDTACEVQEDYYFTLAEGATTLTDVVLQPESGVTKSILGLSRDGSVHTETGGVPGNLEFAFNAATGVISFDPTNPALPGGSPVWVLLKIED